MISDDQIRFLSAILYSIPLSLILRYIPSPVLRKYFSLIMGTLLQFYVYRYELWLPFVTHSLIYGLILLKGRQCGKLITAVSVILLSVYHIYRMVLDYGGWNLDVSTILMMLVCKYSMFAFAYQDGAVPEKDIKIPSQLHNRLVELPSFIDFLVFTQFLPTCIIGTSCQFKDFDDYINQSGDFKQIPLASSLKKSLLDLGISLSTLGVYAFGMFYFPLETMKGDLFPQQNSFYICYYSFFCVWCLKFKYYFGWKLSQLPVHISGFSYKPRYLPRDNKNDRK